MTNTQLSTLAKNVASVLGKEWWFEQKYDQSAILRNSTYPSSFGIVLWLDAHTNRITVRGEWPKDKEGKEYPLHSTVERKKPDAITVSPNRPAADIAADINRRYIEEYKSAFARGMVELTKYEEHINKRNENVKAILEIVNGRVRESGDRIDVEFTDSGYIWDLYVSTDSVSIDFRSLPVELALQFLRLWKAYKKGDENEKAAN